jgi:hypothetical protein
MQKYRVFDIDYDTDGQRVNLPKEMIIELDDSADPSLESADAISDATGWCVNSCSFEKYDDSASPTTA